MKISLCMSSCNQGRFVAETIENARSVGFADHADYEIIVVDDDSTDGSCENLDADHVARIGTRLGCSGGRALAACLSSGDVIIITDPHCNYQYGTLKHIAEVAASKTLAIVQPWVMWEERGMSIGGAIRDTKYGISIVRTHKAQNFPGLFGACYAMTRETLDMLDGLPVLPGWWGRWEQVVTTLCYYHGIPIYVDRAHGFTHRAYRKRHEYPYDIPGDHNVRNSVWYHASFFPKTWETIWRPRHIQAWGENALWWKDLGTREQLNFRDWVHEHAVLDELTFLQTMAKMDKVNWP